MIIFFQVRFCRLECEGVAAYYEGAPLGEYQLEEVTGVYWQREEGAEHSRGLFLLTKEGREWVVEHREGYIPFQSSTHQEVPPAKGWSYRRGPSLLHDPLITATLSPTSTFPCSLVTLSTMGEVARSKKLEDYLGTFTRTSSWNRGRPVFQSGMGKVLWVGHTAWIITDREVMERVGRVKRKEVVVFSGGVAHLCPGSMRATWWFLDTDRRREDPDMLVECKHSK